MTEVNKEFVAYQQALAQRGEGRVVDCLVPGEFHRYHYHGKDKPGFYVVADPHTHEVLKFIPKLNFH